MTSLQRQTRPDRESISILGRPLDRRGSSADRSTARRHLGITVHTALTFALLLAVGQGCGGERPGAFGPTAASTIQPPTTVSTTTSAPPTTITTTTTLPLSTTTSPPTTTVPTLVSTEAPAATPPPGVPQQPQAPKRVPLADCVLADDGMWVGMPGPSPEVALLQTRLAQLGFDPGEIDGYFGENTWRAVLDFAGSIEDGPSAENGLYIHEQVVAEPTFSFLGIAC